MSTEEINDTVHTVVSSTKFPSAAVTRTEMNNGVRQFEHGRRIRQHPL